MSSMSTAGRRFYRPSEVAEYLSVSTRAVQHWISRGDVQALRVGRSWRIPAAEFRRLTGESQAA